LATFQGVFVSDNTSHIYQIDNAGSTVHIYNISGNGIWMALDPASNFCYVCSDSTQNLYIIDVNALTITTLSLDPGIRFNLTVFATTTHAYVVSLNQSASTDTYVSVIDLATNTLVTTLHMPNFISQGSCLTPDFQYLCLSGFNHTTGISTYAYVRTSTNTLIGPNLINSLANAAGNCTATDSTLYVAETSSLGGGPGIWHIPIGGTGFGTMIPAASVDGGGLFYVTNDRSHALFPTSGTGNLIVVDTASNTVAHTDALNEPRIVAYPNPYTDSFILDGAASVLWRYNTAGTQVTSIPITAVFNFDQSPQAAVSPDGSNLYVLQNATTPQTVAQYDTATGAFNWTATISSNVVTLIATPTQIAPATITFGTLFIPRKGFSTTYTDADLYADWLAIELWANNAITPPVTDLYIPNKTSTQQNDILAAFLHVQDWANNVVVPAGTAASLKLKTLFIPTKTSTDPLSLTTSFLAVQDWANSL
jgi:hypothetical protein